MSKPWFRLYCEFVSDPKVQLLAFEDQRHFIALLCLKGNGTLDSAVPSDEYRDRMLSKALGLSVDAALEARRRLNEIGLVSDDWQPVKWESRQYASDSSASRTAAYRHRKSQERHSDVTVTDKNRTEQNRTEKKPARKRASRCPSDFSPDLEYARQHVADIDAEAEAQKFRDWEFKTPRSDWPATWRTWIANGKAAGRYTKRRSTNPLDPTAHLVMR